MQSGSSPPICSVPGCSALADYRVYHCKYQLGTTCLRRDDSCPYLCDAHMTLNETAVTGQSTRPPTADLFYHPPLVYLFTNVGQRLEGFAYYEGIGCAQRGWWDEGVWVCFTPPV